MIAQPIVNQQDTVKKIRQQVEQFAEVLRLEYGMAVVLSVRVVPPEEEETGIEAILRTVSDYFGVPLPVLTKKGRKREVVQARQIAIYFMHKVYKLTATLKQAGTWFGGQDHSTMIHAIRTVEDLRDTDKLYAFHLKQVYERLEVKIGTP